MTDIVPVPNWGGVRQLETNEYATGGLNGNMNEQAKSLAGQNMYSRLYAGLPFDPAFTAQVGGFPIGGRAVLENGDIVESITPNNTTNPNVDMAGWVLSSTNKYNYISELIAIQSPKVGQTYFALYFSADRKVGGGSFVYQEFGTVDNGIVFKAINASGYFIRISMEAIPQVTWYGAVLDGVTDDTVAVQRAFDSPITKATFFSGMAKTTAELTVPRSKPNFKLMSYGVTAEQTGGINAFLTKSGERAVCARSYGCHLDGFSIISGTGVDDGLNTIGFYHAAEGRGSIGRLTHRNFRIMNFSGTQMVCLQTLNYTIQQGTLSGGVKGLYIGNGEDGTIVSTSVNIQDMYIGAQKQFGVDLYAVGDITFSGKNIIEYVGNAGLYADSAAIHGQGIYPLDFYSIYFERNYRNLNLVDCNVLNSSPTYSGTPASNVDIISYVNFVGDQRGNITFERGTIKTSRLKGDDMFSDGVLNITSPMYSTYNLIQQRKLTVGSSFEKGDVTAQSVELVLNSNMNGSGNTGVDGATLNFGVCNSAAHAGSGWIQQSIRRLDNTFGAALTYYHNTGTTRYNPDGTKRKLFELSNNRGAVFVPVTTSVDPINNGEMHFELTSNTQLKIKVKGSDGIVRENVNPMISVSVAYDPPTLAPGIIQSTTITLTGVRLGDFVVCSFNKSLSGTRLWAEITSADTVTVYHQNPTTTTVDVASGAIAVKLI